MAREVDETDERPRRRNKKRSSKSLTKYLILGGVLATVAAIGVILVAVILLWSRVGPERLTAPQHYVIHNSPEDVFHYQEEPAMTVTTQFGKARRSTFTGRAGLGEKVRGYRATALGALTQLTIVCTCSPKDWEAVEPAFARAIESVGPGKKVR